MSLLSPFLKQEVTFACFRMSGNIFVLMLKFKIWVKGAAIICELSRSILALKSSNPVAFEISRVDKFVRVVGNNT